jgi:SAM-dependent methyltransferase
MNFDLNANYWNQRYLKNEFGWDLGAVSPPLKAYIDQLTNKQISILIPGAGNAYEAEYLVNNGFSNVFVCDMAQEPLLNLKKRCPDIKNENLVLGDFFELDTFLINKLSPTFDLILEQTFFCAIDPSLRQTYAEKMHKYLKPNGKLVGLLFNDPLNTDQPPFGGNPEEYHTYFKDLFEIKKMESCYNSVQPRAGRELFINFERKNH